jgi:biopolymer transport protein ExbD/biopolymer transport protein TolR
MGMAISSGGSKKQQVTPSMNVTPLVDVVLVLLIIFMVVTPLLSKQFWLNLPKKDEDAKVQPPSPDQEKNLVLSVSKAGIIKVNTTEIPKAELKDRMQRMLAARADKVVYFDAEDEAPYGTTLEAMDLARQGGAATIAILTEKVVK